MKKKLVIAFIFVILGFLVTFAFDQFYSKEIEMRTWIWDTRLIETDTRQIKEFFVENDVNVVYLQINNNLSFQSYREFIKSMNEINVEVHALEGSPEWGFLNGKDSDQFLNWVSAFQQSSAENEKFTGIHMDIEPYLLVNWETDREEILERYQKTIDDLAKKATEMNLVFGVDIPFWFDEIEYNNKFGKGLLAQWLVENADEITIMAYRDTADEIIRIVRAELDWANELDKQLYIAVETVELPEQQVTFEGNGRKEMEKQLKRVKKHFKHEQSFKGVAIHHYESWKSMKE